MSIPDIPAGMGWPFVDADTGEFQSTAVKGWLSATIDGAVTGGVADYVRPSVTVTHGVTNPLSAVSGWQQIGRKSGQFTLVGCIPNYDKYGDTLIQNANQSDNNTGAWGWETEVDDTQLTFRWRATSAKAKMQIYVDDTPLYVEPVAPVGITVAADTVYTTQLVFPNARRRKVRLFWEGCGLQWLGLNPTGYLTPTSRRGKPLIAVEGDSFINSIVASDYTAIDSWCWGIFETFDVEMIQGGNGGTGYMAPAGGFVFGWPSRINRLIGAAPDYLIVAGTGNDDGFTYTQVKDAATAYYSAWATALPNTKIIVFGAMPRSAFGTHVNQRAVNLNAVRDAATAAPNVVAFIDSCGTIVDTPSYTTGAAYALDAKAIYQGAIYSATVAIGSAPATFDHNQWKRIGWATGTGTRGATTGNGIRDVGWDIDGIHPTKRGQREVLRPNAIRELRRIIAEEELPIRLRDRALVGM